VHQVNHAIPASAPEWTCPMVQVGKWLSESTARIEHQSALNVDNAVKAKRQYKHPQDRIVRSLSQRPLQRHQALSYAAKLHPLDDRETPMQASNAPVRRAV